MKTIIIGLGNPSFSDDGAGALVARTIRSRGLSQDATVVEASVGGLDILDIIDNYQKAVVIDAVQTRNGPPGTIHRFDISQISSGEERIPHNIDLLTSFEIGKRLGLPLPQEIVVYGIEARNFNEPGEEISPPVRAAVSICADKVLAELESEPEVDKPPH